DPQTLCRCPLRFPSVAEGGFAKGGVLLPDRSGFLAVGAEGRVHGSLGQLPRLAQMTSVRLGVGCERNPEVLMLRLACEPQLLFRHRRGIRSDKSKRIESIVEDEIIQF